MPAALLMEKGDGVIDMMRAQLLRAA
jgi:hypothetical protein